MERERELKGALGGIGFVPMKSPVAEARKRDRVSGWHVRGVCSGGDVLPCCMATKEERGAS
jgi:hypothetical protein